MRSLMRAEDYVSPEYHQRELNSIFGRLWILAAIRPMLAEPGAFRTLTLAGKPVALRNCGGKIRAFLNICKHRGARMHEDEFGVAPLVCPYHGWSYNDSLQLNGLPRNKTLFQFDTSAMDRISLHEFAVAEVGGLIFINLSENPLSIREQFGDRLLSVLEQASNQIDSQFAYTRFNCQFNWKLGIENIKDPLHVEVLHTKTFPDTFDTRADRVEIASMDHSSNPDTDWPRISLQQVSDIWDVPMNEDDRSWHALVTRLDGKQAYRGIHLFPNVNLMIVAGAIFSIQIYNPLAADNTEIQMMAATTKPLDAFGHKPLVLWEHIKSDMTVLREDIECLELLQSGLPSVNFEFQHGAYEAGIVNFHSVCKTLCSDQ